MKKRILAMLTLSFMVGCTAKHNMFTIEGEIDTINSNLKEICVKGTCVPVAKNIDKFKVHDRVILRLESSYTSQDVYDPKHIKVLSVEKVE